MVAFRIREWFFAIAHVDVATFDGGLPARVKTLTMSADSAVVIEPVTHLDAHTGRSVAEEV
jgi:hypothetical protein